MQVQVAVEACGGASPERSWAIGRAAGWRGEVDRDRGQAGEED
jgi:hypothetical protein